MNKAEAGVVLRRHVPGNDCGMVFTMFGFGNLKTLAAAAVLVMAAGGASAAMVVPVGTCTSYAGGNTNNLTTSTDCALPGVGKGGNPSLALMAGLFGVKEWTTDLGKIETTDGIDDIDGTFFSLTSNTGNTAGTWLLKAGLFFDPAKFYALLLKGGSNGSIAYLLDTSVTGGNWLNLDIPLNKKNVPGLSNIRLYSTGDLVLRPTPPDVQIPPVPIPAAGFLLLGALGGLAVLRRRRREA